MDSNIPSNIYYQSIGSEILRFGRTTLEINTFVTLSICLLKRMQKQRRKHRSMVSMLNKIFSQHFTVFKVLVDKKANVIKVFSLPWITIIHICICSLHSHCSVHCSYCFVYLFLSFFFLFVFSLVNMLSRCSSVSSIFVSIYLHFLCSFVLAFCTIILVQLNIISETDIFVHNVLLFIVIHSFYLFI